MADKFDNRGSGDTPRRPGGPYLPDPRAQLLPIFIGALIMFYLFFNQGEGGFFGGRQKVDTLATNEFVVAMEEDRVNEVTYRTADGGISGTYWPSDVKKDARTKDTLKRFESVYVGNDSLQELMQAHPKVTFKVDTTSTSFLETVLVSVVPTLLLVGVFIYFMRRISEQNN